MFEHLPVCTSLPLITPLPPFFQCYTEKASPTRHRPERLHNARSNRRKQWEAFFQCSYTDLEWGEGVGVMRLFDCTFKGTWCLVYELCLLAVICVDFM